MKVICGIKGKNAKIEEILKSEDNKKVLGITWEGNSPSIFSKYTILEFKDEDDMWYKLTNDEYFKDFTDKAKEYDTLVFYFNSTDETLDGYGFIEETIGKDIIVTMREEDEKIKVVEYK